MHQLAHGRADDSHLGFAGLGHNNWGQSKNLNVRQWPLADIKNYFVAILDTPSALCGKAEIRF